MSTEINISHLTLVWRLGENVLLIVKNMDVHKNDSMSLMYNLTFKSFHIIPIQRVQKLEHFVEVNPLDEKIQSHYRNQIYRLIPNDKIIESIDAFHETSQT